MRFVLLILAVAIIFLIVDCIEAVSNTSTRFNDSDDSDFSGTAACRCL